jgi:hypothetical protein
MVANHFRISSWKCLLLELDTMGRTCATIQSDAVSIALGGCLYADGIDGRRNIFGPIARNSSAAGSAENAGQSGHQDSQQSPSPAAAVTNEIGSSEPGHQRGFDATGSGCYTCYASAGATAGSYSSDPAFGADTAASAVAGATCARATRFVSTGADDPVARPIVRLAAIDGPTVHSRTVLGACCDNRRFAFNRAALGRDRIAILLSAACAGNGYAGAASIADSYAGASRGGAIGHDCGIDAYALAGAIFNRRALVVAAGIAFGIGVGIGVRNTDQYAPNADRRKTADVHAGKRGVTGA